MKSAEPVAEVVWGNLRIPAILLEGDYDAAAAPLKAAVVAETADPANPAGLDAVQAEPVSAANDAPADAAIATIPWAEPDGGGLPASYNTRELYLTARDPHCLHAHWDFSQEQLELYASFAATGRLELRLHVDSHGTRSDRTFFATAATRSWFFHDVPANSRFTLELGYTDTAGNWSQLAASALITTPPDAIAIPTHFHTAPITPPAPVATPIAPTPVSVPIPVAVEAVVAPAPAPDPATAQAPSMAEVVLPTFDHAVQPTPPAASIPIPAAPGAEPSPNFAPNPSFTPPQQHNEIPHRLVVDWAQHTDAAPQPTQHSPAPDMGPGSLAWQIAPEIAAALRREVTPVSSAELVATSSNPNLPFQAGKRDTQDAQNNPAESQPNPVSSQEFETAPRPKRRGFWFNVNAELIVYGATEPDAALTVDGKPVPLRPDGTFSFRFALPDGLYELPIEALAADREDGRGVTLHFQRKSDYLGPVGQHPQDAALEPPPHAPSPPWPVAV